jgi:TRAP-type C4-dicarboxylate transport system substrate-binding protein
MKRSLAVALSLLFLSSYAQAFTFKIATLSPDGSVWMEKMREGATEIETKTSKRVSFKFYPGGVMGDDASVLKKMHFNQLNGAAVTSGGLSSLYPDIQLYNLVLKFNSLAEVDYIRQKMDAKIISGLNQKNITTLGFAELGLSYLMSTNPIRTLADMKGQKAWSPDNNKLVFNAQKALGVSPIPLAMGDVLMGLQTGMINVVAGSPVGALALQWQTKIKYVNKLPMSYVFGVLAVNKKDFDKLSKEDQSVVSQTMAKVLGEINQRSRDDNAKASDALKAQGIEFIEPTPEAAAELKALLKDSDMELVKSGGLSASLVKELNQHLADFRAKAK